MRSFVALCGMIHSNKSNVLNTTVLLQVQDVVLFSGNALKTFVESLDNKRKTPLFLAKVRSKSCVPLILKCTTNICKYS